MIERMLLEGLVVAASIGSLAFAACGVPPEPTEAAEQIAPPERTLEEAGFDEPGAIEGSNLFNAPRIADGDERPWHSASDNGGMSARADQYAVSGVKTPRMTVPAPPAQPLLLPAAPSPLLLAPGQAAPRAMGLARPAAGEPPRSPHARHAIVCDDYGCSCVSR